MTTIHINEQIYTLTEYGIYDEEIVEVHFNEYTSEIDFSHGFYIYCDDVMVKDCSNYINKWNILTDIKDGIILTNTNKVETEENRYIPSGWVPEEPEVPGIEERLKDLEAAICELADEEE